MPSFLILGCAPHQGSVTTQRHHLLSDSRYHFLDKEEHGPCPHPRYHSVDFNDTDAFHAFAEQYREAFDVILFDVGVAIFFQYQSVGCLLRLLRSGGNVLVEMYTAKGSAVVTFEDCDDNNSTAYALDADASRRHIVRGVMKTRCEAYGATVHFVHPSDLSDDNESGSVFESVYFAHPGCPSMIRNNEPESVMVLGLR